MTAACACEHCGHEFEAEPEGGHRLLCGDATSADDVARLMGGEEADICFTSPPYAQQRDYKTGPQDWDALMAGKSANTSPLSRGRAHAREAAGNRRPWPADKVERWAIDRLIPYAKNARTHSDAQIAAIAAIAASIKEWGWTTPPRLPRGDVGQVRVVVAVGQARASRRDHAFTPTV